LAGGNARKKSRRRHCLIICIFGGLGQSILGEQFPFRWGAVSHYISLFP